jgi:hypothetical protein
MRAQVRIFVVLVVRRIMATRCVSGGGLVVAEDHQGILPGAIVLFAEKVREFAG